MVAEPQECHDFLKKTPDASELCVWVHCHDAESTREIPFL